MPKCPIGKQKASPQPSLSLQGGKEEKERLHGKAVVQPGKAVVKEPSKNEKSAVQEPSKDGKAAVQEPSKTQVTPQHQVRRLSSIKSYKY